GLETAEPDPTPGAEADRLRRPYAPHVREDQLGIARGGVALPLYGRLHRNPRRARPLSGAYAELHHPPAARQCARRAGLLARPRLLAREPGRRSVPDIFDNAIRPHDG